MKPKEMFNDFLGQYKHVSMMLPWLVSGKLNDAEQLVVKQHLDICDQCRAAWNECQALESAFHMRAEQKQWQPPQGHFNQLLELIDAVEPHEQASAVIHDSITQSAQSAQHIGDSLAGKLKPATTSKQHFKISLLIDRLRELPSLFRWVFVVESVALAAFCLMFVVTETTDQVSETALYETLTSTSGIGVEPHRLRVSLVFSESMTEAEIRNLLKSTGGQMVSGPSDLGVYTVELPVSQAAKAKADNVLATYRNNPKVRVLEPEPINADEHL
jgi:hypothetical protein